jgi:hypothetical protein
MSAESFLAKTANRPVDPDLFLWCANIYQAAAGMTMPVENPASKKFQIGERTMSFTDISINRGMMAVMKELGERNASQEDRMAMAWRLMHFGEIFKHAEAELAEFFRTPEDDPEAKEISTAVIKACATARIIVDGESVEWDIPDVIRIARELEKDEDGEQGAEGARG